jgi:hypothetical protein
MKAIDSVLKILVQQGGTELRLASDRRPQMFKGDTELPLTIPTMSADRIRALLDDLWTAHEPEMRRQGQLSFTYSSADVGTFILKLAQQDESTLEVRFRRDGGAPCERDESAQRAPREEAHVGPVASRVDDTRGPASSRWRSSRY